MKIDSDINMDDKEKKDSSSKKGPLSFLSGALTSLLLGWLSLLLSEKVVIYFSTHAKQYSSEFAQSIASGFKTLIIGISFLATFTFLFIGIGLTVVFLRSLLPAKKLEVD